MSQCVQQRFQAEDRVGFDEGGKVVLKDKAQKTLHKYTMHIQERSVYQKECSYDLPPHTSDASIRYLSEKFGIFLQNKNKPSLTLLLDNDNQWRHLHHEGIFLLCPLTNPFFAVENINGGYEIIIDDTNKLQPIAGRPTWKDPYLSVCETGMSRLAVASTNHTLDIYSRGGK